MSPRRLLSPDLIRRLGGTRLLEWRGVESKEWTFYTCRCRRRLLSPTLSIHVIPGIRKLFHRPVPNRARLLFSVVGEDLGPGPPLETTTDERDQVYCHCTRTREAIESGSPRGPCTREKSRI